MCKMGITSDHSHSAPLPLDTQLLLALLDLKTERLLVEAEGLIEAIANRQAVDAALLDRQDRASI
jgi:hypothetical protein